MKYPDIPKAPDYKKEPYPEQKFYPFLCALCVVTILPFVPKWITWAVCVPTVLYGLYGLVMIRIVSKKNKAIFRAEIEQNQLAWRLYERDVARFEALRTGRLVSNRKIIILSREEYNNWRNRQGMS